MKICDLCKKVVPRLESGPVTYPPVEVCNECSADLSKRFRQVEQRVAACKRQWLDEAFAEWKVARTVPDPRLGSDKQSLRV